MKLKGGARLDYGNNGRIIFWAQKFLEIGSSDVGGENFVPQWSAPSNLGGLGPVEIQDSLIVQIVIQASFYSRIECLNIDLSSLIVDEL